MVYLGMLDSFQLQIATDKQFTASVVDTILRTGNFTPSINNFTNYWRLRSRNSLGAGDGRLHFTFRQVLLG